VTAGKTEKVVLSDLPVHDFVADACMEFDWVVGLPVLADRVDASPEA
jgi:hypothetical protein